MTYIHPESEMIKKFIETVIGDENHLEQICKTIFAWFDNNISYSRLNTPFYPLQRSDLNVLEMKSGTCGDYSNFIVSVFLALGFEAEYAYVHKDCFGDDQDHICAAVKMHERWILIDATNPYRKWCGFDCKHQEYELLSPDEFEMKMKKEEAYWTSVAEASGKKSAAGLWYAPWIHQEVVVETKEMLDSVFFLLIMGENAESILYAYYQHYTEHGGAMPCMMTMTNEKTTYQFSINEAKGIWDNEQWSENFLLEKVPVEFKTKEFEDMRKCVEQIKPRIDKILEVLD